MWLFHGLSAKSAVQAVAGSDGLRVLADRFNTGEQLFLLLTDDRTFTLT